MKSIPLARPFLAALDQVVVSGTAFVSTVLVGRWSGPSELGRYKVVLPCWERCLRSKPH